MQGQPPHFHNLPASLPLLNAPLPLRPLVLHYIRHFDPDRLRLLAVSVEEQQQPAILLADLISSPIAVNAEVGRGEGMVLVDTVGLVLKPMCWVLMVLGIYYELGCDVSDPSGATESQKRPDCLLSLKNVLMFKVCDHPPQPAVSMTLYVIVGIDFPPALGSGTVQKLRP